MQVENCLSQKMRDISSKSSIDGLTSHHNDVLSLERGKHDYAEVDVSMTLFEHRREEGPNAFNLGLSISH
jgi:hypothetical protein